MIASINHDSVNVDICGVAEASEVSRVKSGVSSVTSGFKLGGTEVPTGFKSGAAGVPTWVISIRFLCEMTTIGIIRNFPFSVSSWAVVPLRSCIAARCASDSSRYGKSCLYVERSTILDNKSAIMFFFPWMNWNLISNFDKYVTVLYCRGDKCFCLSNDSIACESVTAVNGLPISQCSYDLMISSSASNSCSCIG